MSFGVLGVSFVSFDVRVFLRAGLMVTCDLRELCSLWTAELNAPPPAVACCVGADARDKGGRSV